MRWFCAIAFHSLNERRDINTHADGILGISNGNAVHEEFPALLLPLLMWYDMKVAMQTSHQNSDFRVSHNGPLALTVFPRQSLFQAVCYTPEEPLKRSIMPFSTSFSCFHPLTPVKSV